LVKRSRYKKETQESKALKLLREKKGLSQREAARMIGVPQTVVSHAENGRAYVRDEYVEGFLSSLSYKWEDWDLYVKKSVSDDEIRDKCKDLLNKIKDDRLKLIFELLRVLT